MKKRESELRSRFMKVMRSDWPGAIAIRHEDVRTVGIPDLSVTYAGMTSWWEFKHGTPDFSSPGLQAHTCQRLASNGYCRYVIFHEAEDLKPGIFIVHPRYIDNWKNGTVSEFDAMTVRFDFDWLMQFMKIVHGTR
jgi:hypothetical protein